MLISFEDITANYKIIEQNKTNNRLLSLNKIRIIKKKKKKTANFESQSGELRKSYELLSIKLSVCSLSISRTLGNKRLRQKQ